jgi:DNA-binding MarR family transcriptional regulator
MRKTNNAQPAIPAIGEGKRGETGHIGYLLRQAHAAHRIRMEHALQGIGLTLPQFSVLVMLDAYPGASSADLARLSLLTPQTLSVIVGNLARDGVIARRPHEQHGRIQLIDITAAGRVLLEQGKAATQAVESALLAGVAEADQLVIRHWLVQIAKQGASAA